MYVGWVGCMDSMGTIKVARPEAKEEKKREKKLQKIELSGFSLPSPALLAVKFLRNPYFLFFLFPSFFTLSPLPKTMATGRLRNPTKKKKRKKERKTCPHRYDTGNHPIPPLQKNSTYEIAQFYCPCE